jgi:hypothetical protein
MGYIQYIGDRGFKGISDPGIGKFMAENNNSDIQIADIMTYSGILTSISRFGMKRNKQTHIQGNI